MATQSIARPVPRPSDHRVLVLDTRPLLLGLEWQLLPSSPVPFEDLCRRFVPGCPDGYMIGIEGGTPEERDGVTFLHVEDGQVLIFEYLARPGPAADDASDRSSPRSSDGSRLSRMKRIHPGAPL